MTKCRNGSTKNLLNLLKTKEKEGETKMEKALFETLLELHRNERGENEIVVCDCCEKEYIEEWDSEGNDLCKPCEIAER